MDPAPVAITREVSRSIARCELTCLDRTPIDVALFAFSVMGILLAVTFLSGISSFTKLLTGSDEFGFFPAWGGWLSLAGFAAVAWVLIRIPLRPTRTG